MSNFLKFYEKHGISPVSQDIGDIGLHFHRRIGLYRTLGITPLFFKNRDVLEVAPGSGYNSIVTASFGANCYDLVEPNIVGFSEMISLFEKHEIKDTSVHFFNSRLEDFVEKREYDIVLCEGLIPGLDNQDEFILSLASRVRSGGVLVVTCADVVSLFYETLRRYLSRILTSHSLEKDTFGSSAILPILTETFKPHMATLSGKSRPAEDWVYDTLLNPAASNIAVKEFSIERCLCHLSDSFWYYGSSPNFLSHMCWYKEIERESKEYNSAIIKSYKEQQHNLLHYKEVGKSNIATNEKISSLCLEFTKCVDAIDIANPGQFSQARIIENIAPVKELLSIVRGIKLFKSESAISEFLNLFRKDLIPSAKEISEVKDFSTAFGRGQQYISMVKI
jgi:2-polyprenyl-3-methyl-5-hydroxy-6-metoxy-1,4-benzoquinol methylase